MKFKVLGCSGSRTPGYHLTSYLINKRLLVDAGAAAGALDLEDQAAISDILVSHSNLDHTKDILFIADNLLCAGLIPKDPVVVRSMAQVLESIKTNLLNNDVWPDFTALPTAKRPILALEPLTPCEAARIAGLTVRPFPVNHATGSTGFIIHGKDPAEHVCVVGDTGANGGWVDFLNSMPFPVANLVVETSFPDEMHDVAMASKHLTPSLLKDKLSRLKHKPRLFIVHIKAPFATAIQAQLQKALSGYSYQLLRKGDNLVF